MHGEESNTGNKKKKQKKKKQNGLKATMIILDD